MNRPTKKNATRKLQLNKETVRTLERADLSAIVGGVCSSPELSCPLACTTGVVLLNR